MNDNTPQAFIATSHPAYGVAFDSAHVYWSNADSIGRANLDGTQANQSFITGVNGATGVAIDSAHIYWGHEPSVSGGKGEIGRANLDGTGVTQDFLLSNGVTPISIPVSVAVDSARIYWTGAYTDEIESARLDGVFQGALTSGVNEPWGIAVDSAHIYWANYNNGSIARANLDGTGTNQNFITGADNPCSVAVNSGYVYWGNWGSFSIGRANLNGTGTNQYYIGYAGDPCALAVDALPPKTAFLVLPSAWTLTAAGAIDKGVIVRPVLKKPHLIGLVVFKIGKLGKHITPGGLLPLGRHTMPGTRITRVGFVPLGRHSGSKQRIRWNLKVNGKTLGNGTYEVHLKIFTAAGKPTNLPEPNPVRLVINNGRTRVSR
jgi:hypothetical protein